MAMHDPFPLVNLAALSQVDELEGDAYHSGYYYGTEGYPTHQHATASTTTAASGPTLTSPTAAAAALHHAHHHYNPRHSIGANGSGSSTVSAIATAGASSPSSLRKRRSAAALALINRGWTRLGGAVGPRVSPTSAGYYDGSSHYHQYGDATASSTMPYTPEEAFQIKLSLMIKNPAIMARFQERLRADSPHHGHDAVVRIEMQDFFLHELVLVDLGPEIRQASNKMRSMSGDCTEGKTVAAASTSSRSYLFRSLAGALVNKADETTNDSNNDAVQQLQFSSPTASSWLNMSPFKNEGSISTDSSDAQNTTTADATTTLRSVAPSTSPTGLDSSNTIENKRPACLNLPLLEIQSNTTTTSISSPILENSVYEQEFIAMSSSSCEETPDATESSSCEESSSSSSHDDDDILVLSSGTYDAGCNGGRVIAEQQRHSLLN